MKVIGICGPSGSGKSTLCHYLGMRGCVVFDCDAIYHELIENPTSCLAAIEKAFGSKVIANGAVDRAALRKIVFSDPEKLARLNALTHSFVIEELERRLQAEEEKGTSVCVIDAPLFFEAGLETRCDLVCAVIADEAEQIRRICRRDGISESLARERLGHQISPEELKKKVDLVLLNNGDLKEIDCFAEQMIQKTLL